MIAMKLVQQKIHDLCSLNKKDTPEKDYKKAQKRVAFLQLVKKYLETSPSALFLTNEIARIENRMTLILEAFSHSHLKNEDAIKKERKKYEKFHEFPKMREQVKTMRFILKN